MTEGEKTNHKEKVKKVMIDQLTSAVNYPNCTPDQIMSQLKNMWLKIEEEGLLVEDMNYQAFCAYANHCFMVSQVQDFMGL